MKQRIRSLENLSLDEQYLLLSAWQAAKKAYIAEPKVLLEGFALGAALEIDRNKVISGSAFIPAIRHSHDLCKVNNALAAVLKSAGGVSGKITSVALICHETIGGIPAENSDILRILNRENPEMPIFLSTAALEEILRMELIDLDPTMDPEFFKKPSKEHVIYA